MAGDAHARARLPARGSRPSTTMERATIPTRERTIPTETPTPEATLAAPGATPAAPPPRVRRGGASPGRRSSTARASC